MSDLPPLSAKAKTLQTGTYQHFKGRRYQVLAVARHSESLEEVVVYQALYGDHGMWVRPLNMFLETVEIEEKKIPRFRFVAEEIDEKALHHRRG